MVCGVVPLTGVTFVELKHRESKIIDKKILKFLCLLIEDEDSPYLLVMCMECALVLLFTAEDGVFTWVGIISKLGAVSFLTDALYEKAVLLLFTIWLLLFVMLLILCWILASRSEFGVEL